MSFRKIASMLILGAVGFSVLAGCGRRSAPITPYEAALQERREAQEAGEALPPEPAPPKEDRRFLLDPLID